MVTASAQLVGVRVIRKLEGKENLGVHIGEYGKTREDRTGKRQEEQWEEYQEVRETWGLWKSIVFL